MAEIAFARKDMTAGQLRAAAAKASDARSARRILAIALVVGGRRQEDGGGDLRDGSSNPSGPGASIPGGRAG